ncbi:unnamed protein product [Trichogramma brassicae]|uniref:Lipid-binding serum glycoprotein N-terminal domain-containing protein n=1 Tax=Trichogramma brassicae TaxID=86971 RepID=A0A6H5I1G3_9HYME|nr:unnamed protein product [Trichogramma brassicae]
MRAVSCLLLLVAVAHLSEASIYDIRADIERYAVTRSMSSKLRTFLESLKGYMQTGNDELGIPKMDPFETKFQAIDLKKHDLVLKGNVSEVHVEGLSDYKVVDVDFKMGQKNLTIGLKWPRIHGTTKYSVDASYSEKVSIYGTAEPDRTVQRRRAVGAGERGRVGRTARDDRRVPGRGRGPGQRIDYRGGQQADRRRHLVRNYRQARVIQKEPLCAPMRLYNDFIFVTTEIA